MPKRLQMEIYANRPLLIGQTDKGEPVYAQRGDRLPDNQFGSGNSLRAALNAGHVTQRPVWVNEDGTPVEDDHAERIAELEAQVADLRAQLSGQQPKRRSQEA